MEHLPVATPVVVYLSRFSWPDLLRVNESAYKIEVIFVLVLWAQVLTPEIDH